MKKPYKYLDNFTEEDGDIFFGREKESDILLSDIVISRLVVLFAKTGTGKTSLLRAGVSPQLRELGYTTIYTQVKEDPYESLRQSLGEQKIPRIEQDSLPDQLALASQHLDGRPIVIFFDQFEEFFFEFERHRPRKASQFIQDIAEVCLGRKERVHVVFSLREDFYYGMNSFRSSIPAIFHNDSNLHLLPFEEKQARRAITGPLEREGLGFSIEPELVDQLVKDLAGLSEGELIEPAQLQIICDTLWQKKIEPDLLSPEDPRPDLLSLEDYTALGGTKGILETRIQKDLKRDLNNEELDQFGRLIDFLSDRKRDVKRPRQFNEVVEYLKQGTTQVEELVRKLKKVGILRERTLENVRYVEWITDYVAKNIEGLESAVRAIATTKKHLAFVEHYQQASTSQDLDEATHLASRLPEEFEEISANVHLLTLNQEEAEFMFLCSLEYDLATRTWFDIGQQCRVAVWGVLQEKINKENPTIEESQQAAHAVKLLRDLYADPVHQERAIQLLRLAINNRNLAGAAIGVLGARDTPEAFDELQAAALQEELVTQVINSLAVNERAVRLLDEIMKHELGEGSLHALEAAGRLYQVSLGRPGRATSRAQAFFQETVRNHGLEFFDLALQYCFESKFWFDKTAQGGADPWKTLEASLHQKEDIQKARHAILLLGELGSSQALTLLESAVSREDLADDIGMALEHIRENKDTDLETSDRAVKLLKSLGSVSRQPPEKDARRPPERYHSGENQKIFDLITRALTQGRFLPFLGPGMAPAGTPALSELARGWAQKYRYPFADSQLLARVASYIAIQQGRKFAVDLLVEELSKWSPADRDPYSLLAEFQVPIYLTTEYHELLENALKKLGKRPTSASIQWKGNGQEKDRIESDSYYPTVGEPLVYHLYGQISRPETIMITEDDFLDFVVCTSRDRWLIPTMVRKGLVASSVAYLGLDLGDTSFQVLNRQNTASLRFANVIALRLSMETSYDDGGGLRYIEHYLKERNIFVYWGTAGEFLQKLHDQTRS